MIKVIFEKDKWLHFFIGMSIAATVTCLLGFLGFIDSMLVCSLLGFIAATLVGLLKEIGDKYVWKGTPSLADFMFTMIGGFGGGFMVGLFILNTWA